MIGNYLTEVTEATGSVQAFHIAGTKLQQKWTMRVAADVPFTKFVRLYAAEPWELEAVFDKMSDTFLAGLQAEGMLRCRMVFECRADFRYKERGNTVKVALRVEPVAVAAVE